MNVLCWHVAILVVKRQSFAVFCKWASSYSHLQIVSSENEVAEEAPVLGYHQLQVNEGICCEERKLHWWSFLLLQCVLLWRFNTCELVEIWLFWSNVLHSLQSLVKAISVLGPKWYITFWGVYFWSWAVQLNEWKSRGLHWKCLFQSHTY